VALLLRARHDATPKKLKPWYRYGLAVAGVLAATVVTAAIPVVRERFPFFFFWPLVLAVAWFLGTGPALATTLLSALAVAREMTIDASGNVMLSLFTLVGVAAAWVSRWRAGLEMDLHESRERFATMANAAPVLIWVADDGECTYVNSAWLEFTGRLLEQEIGDGWLESVHPDDRARCRETRAKAFEVGVSFEMEYRLRRSDAQFRYVLERGVPRRGRESAVVGYIGSCMDITEQRSALASAEKAREAAEVASRTKDSFLATVSHEMRAPLSPIITWAQVLRTATLSREQADNALTVIERNARLQAQIIEDLLDVSRIVEGKLRLRVRPVLLHDVVRDAIETIRPAAQAKEIRLQVVLDTTVAPIPGDADRLQQIVWNLLSNAVKFTERGGRIHVVLERVNSHVEIAVSDTGLGIAPEQLTRLFERFWQADSSTTRAHAGLGLGLAIVRHLVELHGGSVTAESPGEGQGSTFTVKLPVAPVARTADEEIRRHPTIREGAQIPLARLDGIRILLVDDEPDANEALRLFLAGYGAEVRVAGSATLALEILDRWTPDVLLTDIGMPSRDGYSLLAEVRARTDEVARLPAIALTAYASSDDRTRLLSAGFQLHLAKPAQPAELLAAIVSVIAR
jgi:PAS domain S-box-containing protein